MGSPTPTPSTTTCGSLTPVVLATTPVWWGGTCCTSHLVDHHWIVSHHGNLDTTTPQPVWDYLLTYPHRLDSK